MVFDEESFAVVMFGWFSGLMVGVLCLSYALSVAFCTCWVRLSLAVLHDY